jgi:methylglutaconyl-CoA hydratase
VDVLIDGGAASITFSHPKGNCLTSTMLGKLAEAVRNLDSRTDITCIAIQSLNGKPFCSGAYFDELLALGVEVSESETSNLLRAIDFFSGFARVISALYQSPKITIALVNGKAVGGGVGLISACDYVIASKEASVKLSELSIGIGPFVISEPVTRKIGVACFANMSIDGEWRDAEWALSNGLFSLVVPEAEFTQSCSQFLQELSNRPNSALTELKNLLREIAPLPSLESMLLRAKTTAKLALSKECQTILSAFRDKSTL